MSIIYSPKTRRQFLVGAGGSLLALPLLPSLMSSEALAQTAGVPRRMMNFVVDHHNEAQFWLNPSVATTSVGTIGIKERLLSSMGTSSSSVIGSLMSNPLYNTLLANNQITIIRGLENHQQGDGHVTRALGGHVTVGCALNSDNPSYQSTIDYLVEASPTVFANTPSNITKSVRIDLGECWYYVQKIGNRSVNPGAYGYNDISAMYNAVFGSLTGQTVPTADLTNVRKTNILNRVFPAFQSYKANRKISAEDKLRLDQHLGFLSDLQKSVSVVTPPVAISCTKPANNFAGATKIQLNNLYVDLMAIAFKCGLTQFGCMRLEAEAPVWLPGYTGGPDFHGIMHGQGGLAAQHNGYSSFQKFAYNLIADRFLTPLNVEEGSTGRTYVDNMITTCLSQLGMQREVDLGNHVDGDVQHTLFGSMGGRLRAGRYYSVPGVGEGYVNVGVALPANTFSMTQLELMGVPPSEYNKNSSVTGKGFGYYKTTNYSALGSRIYTPITEMLT